MPWYNGDVKKDVVMMKTKQRAVIAVAVIVLLAAAILGAKPMYNLYRDISFYHGERTEAEKTVKAFAEEKGISYGEYPQSLIDLYERNPETKDFVLNYPFRKDTGVDLSAWEGSRTVPLFLQWNPMWGYERYGKDFLAVTGCGPTCLAMVGYYLTGDENMNPRQVAQFAQENGYYSRGSGSSWTLISEGSGGLGLKATEIPLVRKKMVDALEAGKPIICAMREGDFTTTGHYIVLRGVEDGQFQVNDPNSVVNSEKLWSYEQIEGQIRNLWVMEKA